MLEELLKTLSLPVIIAIITSIITNYIIKKNNDKTLFLRYVTEERAKWRDFIKNSTSIIYSKDYKNENKKAVITKLILNLNPQKSSAGIIDDTIIKLLGKIEGGLSDDLTLKQLRFCVSMLLKHDWERAKIESKGGLREQKEESERLDKILKDFKDWLDENRINL
ncbi:MULTISPECIES: hypothetical protein [unclassified Paenibacillus]|uniref:hypothetical protein n=1 Tax=unclassified Paenibacillus TaxID=185978 RepID=UPI00020D7851|nr:MULTISPECIES: hypothetical protein [unclassified Paenibacillus]EGL19821.1 hypothetical protein HMPREF9413_4821 [Paenibacillus sp. HGF7]EPD81323.1 hypothetical protein HMPREF1207_05080 [Paenibacillus sp. HGH0039]